MLKFWPNERSCSNQLAFPPPPAVYAELQQRLAQRDSLLGCDNRCASPLHALTHTPVVITAVKERMEQLICTLTAQIEQIDAELEVALAKARSLSLGRLCRTTPNDHRHRPSRGSLAARHHPQFYAV